MFSNCSKEKLEEFSKNHFTYINQIFGDATVRQIIEEEYPTTYEFKVEETGADFDFSFHHTVKDREDDNILCSVADGYQNIYKNKNDTLCQSYSLMNYFDIEIPDDKRDRQMAMVQMYRDILNGTLENFEGVDFKGILNQEILREKANKNLWSNFVKGRGYISMNKTTFFKNIENTLDDWEEFGYWYFIGKGNCPKHDNYSSEMRSQNVVSRELSRERDEGYYMGVEDVRNKMPSKSASKSRSKSASSKSASSKSASKSASPKSASETRRSKSASPKSVTKTRRTNSASPKSASETRRSKSSSPKSVTKTRRTNSASPKSVTKTRKTI
jgi:hypothetical protein